MENKNEIIAKPKKFINHLEYYYSRKHETITCDICGKDVLYFGMSKHRTSKFHNKALMAPTIALEKKAMQVMENNTVETVTELIKAKLVNEINELNDLKNQLLELKNKKIIPRKVRTKKVNIVDNNDDTK